MNIIFAIHVLLVAQWDQQNSKCSAKDASKWLQSNPGLVTAECFDQVLHIPVIDTRDGKDHSHKFHAFGIVRTVTGEVDEWYLKKHDELDSILGVDTIHHHRPRAGVTCCSPNTISFHYVEAGESLAFWEVLQKVHEAPYMSDEEVKEIMNKVWPRDRAGLGGYAHGLPSMHSNIWNALVHVVRKISGGAAVRGGDPLC